MIQSLIFYVFSFVLLASSILVVTARNPVHAVLFLVLCFFNAAGLFLLMGAEFVAFILVIVYVGAVAVLFLFVVMMLDVDFHELRKGAKRYMALGLTVGAVLVAELLWVAGAWVTDIHVLTAAGGTPTDVENTRAIGQVLYTTYIFPFQVSGLILLVAMIGAIVLTLRHRKDARRQKVSQQLDRQISDVIDIVKVESGKGVS